jgi:hypothetical protein
MIGKHFLIIFNEYYFFVLSSVILFFIFSIAALVLAEANIKKAQAQRCAQKCLKRIIFCSLVDKKSIFVYLDTCFLNN